MSESLVDLLKLCDPHDTDEVIKHLNAAAREIEQLTEYLRYLRGMFENFHLMLVLDRYAAVGHPLAIENKKMVLRIDELLATRLPP